MTVDIAVVAPDAQPGIEPHKISRKAGYNKADVTLTLNPIAGAKRYYALVVNNAERNGESQGFPPAIQRGLVCGIGNRCGPGRRSLNVANAVVADDVTVAELAAMGDDTEGLHSLFVWFLTTDGWNT